MGVRILSHRSVSSLHHSMTCITYYPLDIYLYQDNLSGERKEEIIRFVVRRYHLLRNKNGGVGGIREPLVFSGVLTRPKLLNLNLYELRG